ncbi:serine hydrolase domain-containing protein [Pseudonocardia eucalypti]|uniref:Serine hydrolase domain-containing protein n=1 Tax=Pseudonocardia eucalypti TaxID=648755 RepID=A0ABP9PJ60_9PSEU|nr:CubicO group peptidase (beta-lactamase class C family) [Pseudonocardia eucalypti]
MSELTPAVDPGEVGLDSERLARIDTHFARYVDDGRLAGWLAVVARQGQIAYLGLGGQRDTEAGLPVTADTLWRIYSMSKPVTSVAAMTLVEEGRLELTDPIHRFLPEFAEPRVYVKGSAVKPVTVPATEPIRVWHLLTHTAGLTYGFHHTHPVDAIYRANGFEWGTPKGLDLAACCEAWAKLPLVFQPGSEWNYSVATDVLGRVIEVVSGQSLDQFFAERIFEPLGMTDTGFVTPDVERTAALYTPDPRTGERRRNDAMGAAVLKPRSCLSGGGGLVSSAADYHRFTQMLLGGGALNGTRVLGSRTLAYMARNHLPGDQDLEQFGRPLFAESPMAGMGFGLGFSVVKDAAAVRNLCSEGEFAWGGAASTAFWVDPREELTALFFTQLLPSSTHPIRSELRTLVYQAVVD